MKKNNAVLLLGVEATVLLVAVSVESFFLAWVAWGLMFATLEVYALARRDRGDTLSEQIWLGTRSTSFLWSVIWRGATLVILSWLMAHFLFGFVV